MAGKGLDTGKAFFSGVLSKITDPEQRAAAEKLLTNEAFLTEIGSGVAGQSEIDRQLQGLKVQKEELDTRAQDLDQRTDGLETWHANLTEWHKENKTALEEAKRIREGKAGGNGDGVKKPEPPVGTGITEEKLGEILQNERAAFLGYSRDQNLIMREHLSKFKEIPDLDPLLHHPKIAELGLRGVYELIHKDRLDKWKTDEATAAEEKIRLDERQKVQASMAQLPYQTPTGAGSGSPLDALTVGKPDSLVDAATAHYNRLVTERNGAAAPTGR